MGPGPKEIHKNGTSSPMHHGMENLTQHRPAPGDFQARLSRPSVQHVTTVGPYKSSLFWGRVPSAPIPHDIGSSRIPERTIGGGRRARTWTPHVFGSASQRRGRRLKSNTAGSSVCERASVYTRFTSSSPLWRVPSSSLIFVEGARHDVMVEAGNHAK